MGCVVNGLPEKLGSEHGAGEGWTTFKRAKLKNGWRKIY